MTGHSGVSKVLELFAVKGIVLRSAAGYQRNRGYVAFPAITLLATLRTCFNGRVRAWATQCPGRVCAVGVFGSMARRDGGSDSGIDLLVITTDQAECGALRGELPERVAAHRSGAPVRSMGQLRRFGSRFAAPASGIAPNVSSGDGALRRTLAADRT